MLFKYSVYNLLTKQCFFKPAREDSISLIAEFVYCESLLMAGQRSKELLSFTEHEYLRLLRVLLLKGTKYCVP